MIRKLNEALSMDELFDSIRRNAEAIITDIDEIEGKDCKLDNEGMSLLKKAQKEIIGVRSRMSGVRTSCSAMYGKNESFCMRKFNRLNESFDDIDGYAVDIRDMGKGYHHLLLFNDIADAEYAYDRLDDISDSDMDDEDITIAVNAVVDTCNEVVNEIDWRREIDKNDVWTAGDNTRYQIVGEVDLWLYW